MSRTNRNARATRNDEDTVLEKLWEEVQAMEKERASIEEEIVARNRRIIKMESGWGENPPANEVTTVRMMYDENLEAKARVIKLLQGTGEGDNDCIKGKLSLMAALQEANEQNSQAARPSKRGGNSNLVKSSISADVETNAELSAASSPAMDGKSRTSRPQKMSSLPPKMGSLPPKEAKDAPIKREDSEAPDVQVRTSKVVVFALGAEVAFKPKPVQGKPEPEWIQGTVVKVIGEGKSRRYDVQDPEPDEETGEQKIHRTFASMMATIPPLGAPLPEYPVGKVVLARYPDTTTFYVAKVAGNVDNEVILSFDGEDDKEKVVNIDRRFVLDHRG